MASITEIKAQLARATRVTAELETEYARCLEAKNVSHEARILTHEVFEKCSNTLDQSMHLAWSTRVLPKLKTPPKRGGYFPVASDEGAFASALGQWNAANLATIDPDFEKELRRWQPMTSTKNAWLLDMKHLANRKHTGLVPQKRMEEKRVSVSGKGGTVSWGRGVTFGKGVSIFGVPVDPKTQLPKDAPGITTKVEIWVSFLLEGTSLNPLSFCRQAVSGVETIVDSLAANLKLG